jgi:hypothetical protein
MTFVTVIGAVSASELVEIRLVDDIDESRGYCLDIAGGKGTSAPIENGLQAHTCYDYTGALLEDQSFEVTLINEGLFKITYFNVCMAASAASESATLILETCDPESSLQNFSLEQNGHLVLEANQDLCITVSSTEKREGRGSTPVHVMRPITLESCTGNNSAYQQWTIFNL